MTVSFWIAVAGLILGALIAAALIVLGVIIVRHERRKSSGDEPFGWIFVAFGLVGIIGVLCGAGFGLYPYKSEYHSWREHHGTIAQIDSRLIGGYKSGSSQKFVVRFDGDSQLYGLDDTRAATLKKGDRLSIECIRTHQWGGGVDGYDCRWNQ